MSLMYRHYLNAALVLPVITLIASWEMMHLGTHTYEYIYIYIVNSNIK